MSNTQPLQTNFTSGEISPYLYAHSDLQQYAHSARQITNFIVRPQGGLLKRSGTQFVAEIANSSNNAFLIPFIYSNTDAYQIEMGAGYFRFYRNGGQILSSTAFTNGTMVSNITGWTTNNSGTGSAAYNSANGGSALLQGGSSGVGAIFQSLNYFGTSTYTVTLSVYTNTITYKVGTALGLSNVATGTVTAGIGQTFTFTPTTPGFLWIQFSNAVNNSAYVNNISLNTPVYQITNTFTQNELSSVRWSQSFDTLYLLHNSHIPSILQRTGHAQWAKSDITFTDGPYYNVSDVKYGGLGTNINITASGTTGSITLTSSASLFVSTDVGRLIRYRSTNTAAWGWAIITAFSSGTSVTATVNRALDASGTASAQWRLGYFSVTTGYPGIATIYQQRLVLGALTTAQQTTFFSNTADLYNMQPDDTNFKDNQIDSSAMVYTIADNQGNVINGFSTLSWFFAYTSGGIWLIDSSSSPGGPITPSTISMKKVISEPAASVPPAICRTSVVYSHLFGRKLLEIGYNWATNLYVPTDLAVLAEQRTVSQVQWSVVQTSPNYVIWNLMQDGTLSAVTYYKEQQITGWHQHILGGTNAIVKAISVIPGPKEDEVWMIVSRTINGTTKQYIEYLSPTFLLNNDVTTAQFLDCSAQYNGVSTTTLSGLDYLEGQTVQVFGNGGVVTPTGPVTEGALTLQTPVTQCWVGLGYTSTLLTNVPVSSSQGAGPTNARLGRVYEADVYFYNSYGGRIGQDTNNAQLITQYGNTTIMGSPITLFSGVSTFNLMTDFKREPTVFIDHSLPVPIHISSIVYRTSFSNAV